MFCYQCGAQLEDRAVFCHKCGAKLIDDNAKQDSTGMADHQEQSDNIQMSVSKKKKRKLPIILGVIGVLFVLLITIGTISESNNSNSQSHHNSTGINLSETYTNEEEGFSFKYPSGWIPISEDEFASHFGKDEEYPLLILANEIEDLPEENSYIMVSRFDVAQDAIDHLFIDDEQFASTFDNDVTIEDTSTTEIDGVAARKITYSGKDGIGYQSYFYAVAPALYRIDFVYNGKSVGNKQRFFNAVIDSFKITAAETEMDFNEENILNNAESMDSHTVLKQTDVPFQEKNPVAEGHMEGIYYIGDTASMSQTHPSGETGSYDITMTDWGTYYESVYDDIYVYAVFEVVNTGNEDISISEYSFSAYVNDYKVDIGCLLADDSLSATLSSGRRTNGKLYIQMNPEDVNQLELELGDIIFRIQDNSFTDEIPFGYEGEEDYTDYIEWGGIYDDGWLDTTLTFSLYSDGSQNPECGSLTTNFRGMSDTGKLYYLGGNSFRWESEGYIPTGAETYYVYAVYNNQEYQLELYNSNNEYEVTFTLYEQYIP